MSLLIPAATTDVAQKARGLNIVRPFAKKVREKLYSPED